jgi:hypothetical protein
MNTDSVVFTGTLCTIAWLVTYLCIIYRGFKDRTFGMPVAALAGNLSWEAIYAFFLDPLGDFMHVQSIAWFFVDVVIVWQVLKYGREDFSEPFMRRYFRAIVCAAIIIAFPVMYFAFLEFRDPLGYYTGFGLTFMMSFLFIAMLLRRGSPAGQSMYIAIFKWLGNFLAYIAAAFSVTTTMADPLPDSFTSFVVGAVTHTTYPLTPLVNVLYLVTFLGDVLYIVLLYSYFKARNLSPWRRTPVPGSTSADTKPELGQDAAHGQD